MTHCAVFFQSALEGHSVPTAREDVGVRTMPRVTQPPVNANVNQDIQEADAKQVSGHINSGSV